MGDFNGDGRQDLAVANLSTDNVSILIGTSIGTFGGADELCYGGWPALSGGWGF